MMLFLIGLGTMALLSSAFAFFVAFVLCRLLPACRRWAVLVLGGVSGGALATLSLLAILRTADPQLGRAPAEMAIYFAICVGLAFPGALVPVRRRQLAGRRVPADIFA